jgi:hypothetical protein
VFDPPAKVVFPNVGGAPAGAVLNIISFDHDVEEFVEIGTATVSEDGRTVVSDPGSGILKAGWGWGQNPPPLGGQGSMAPPSRGSSARLTLAPPGPYALDVGEVVEVVATLSPGRNPIYGWNVSGDSGEVQVDESDPRKASLIGRKHKADDDPPDELNLTGREDVPPDQNPKNATTQANARAKCEIIGVRLEPLHGNLDSKDGGRIIFAGKAPPGDGDARNELNVVVEFSEEFVEGTFFVAVADVDDPSAGGNPIDTTGDAGHDNIGDGGIGGAMKAELEGMPKCSSAGLASDTVDCVRMDVSQGDKSEFELKFTTSLSPGDNYRAVAACEQTYLDALQVDKTAIKHADDGPLPKTSSGGTQAVQSELLTVWRKLNIERDGLDLSGNQPEVVIDRFEGKRIWVVESTPPVVDDTSAIPKGRFENGTVETVSGAAAGTKSAPISENKAVDSNRHVELVLTADLKIPAMLKKRVPGQSKKWTSRPRRRWTI